MAKTEPASLGSVCYVFALSDNHRMCYSYNFIMVSVLLEVFFFFISYMNLVLNQGMKALQI